VNAESEITKNDPSNAVEGQRRARWLIASQIHVTALFVNNRLFNEATTMRQTQHIITT